MLITVVLVPGPPAFVPELMGTAAHELDDLRHAADRVLSGAVSDLMEASAHPLVEGPVRQALSEPVRTQLVVVGPGPPGEFNADGPVSFADFGRDVSIPALVEGEQSNPDLPTSLMVARYLASRDVSAHPGHAELWASARWITTDGADATALGEELGRSSTHVALVLVADGANCHGPKAPRAEDSRALAYDQGLCIALASGQPGRLAEIDVDLGRELGATGPQVWPVLLAAAHGGGTGELLWRGAPYGVGWAIAIWRGLGTVPNAGVAPA